MWITLWYRWICLSIVSYFTSDMTDCNCLGWMLFLHYPLLLIKPQPCMLHIHTVLKCSNIISFGVSFFLSWVSTSFLWNSTSFAKKTKANVELSSLCPLHLSQILFFLQRYLRKKQTVRMSPTLQKWLLYFYRKWLGHDCSHYMWYSFVLLDRQH